MKKIHIYNKATRKNLKNKEYLIRSLKYLLQSAKVALPFRIRVQTQFNPKILGSNPRNSCILTYRNRSVSKKFKLTRMMLKSYISNGYITGYKSSS